MTKNLIPTVCKLLDVEVGEEFKIGGYGDKIFMFTSNGLECRNIDRRTLIAVGTLQDLLRGISKIIKLPWKPKKDETVYTFLTLHNELHVAQMKYKEQQIECLALLKAGWVYRTKEEAEAELPKVAEKLGVDYEI